MILGVGAILRHWIKKKNRKITIEWHQNYKILAKQSSSIKGNAWIKNYKTKIFYHTLKHTFYERLPWGRRNRKLQQHVYTTGD